MPAAVMLKTDLTAQELRGLAKRSKDAKQSRRLLSLAAVKEGRSRGEAAAIGGMDRQTLRDWVHRFNTEGLDGLRDHWWKGPAPRLTEKDKKKLAAIVEAGPDPEKDGIVRWRRVDIQRLIEKRFGVAYHKRYVGTLLKQMGFSHISARPRHPGQDKEVMAAFKKLCHHLERPHRALGARNGYRSVVPG